jgi:hypothetical protein
MLLRIARGMGERPIDLLANTLDEMEENETSATSGNQDLKAT